MSTVLSSSSKNIAIVINTSWNIYNFRKGLVQRLIKDGHSVFCMAPTDDFSPEFEKWGAHFVPVNNIQRKGTNPLKDLSLIFELKNLYKKHQIDIALLYTIKPNIYGILAAPKDVKTVCTVTGLGYSFIKKGWINKLVRKLYKKSFNNASQIYFQNSDDLALFNSLKIGNPRNMEVVPGSGINTSYFAPGEKSNNSPSHPFRFLFVGRLLNDKGIRELRQATEILHTKNIPFSLDVVGSIDRDNPAAMSGKELEEWTQKPYIRYHGQVEDPRPFIRNCDALVLPSYREGLPRGCLEAMSMARPLIVTDVPGCRETVIDGKNGYLCEVQNPKDLAEKMTQLAMLPGEELKSMGAFSRQMALEKFDEQIIIQYYLDVIEKLGKRERNS
ncbi:glycosyltransferase family 4 protein [Membranihabitans maritimus]|uniref:glycosyltransferase family 4 protein n=1 Tax=Membranihabitans maritimus TaxID=2904244 RepID=UPI001F47422C|nr:glycosyltransferase family 4 protein [Membranihabitans maritimus]